MQVEVQRLQEMSSKSDPKDTNGQKDDNSPTVAIGP